MFFINEKKKKRFVYKLCQSGSKNYFVSRVNKNIFFPQSNSWSTLFPESPRHPRISPSSPKSRAPVGWKLPWHPLASPKVTGTSDLESTRKSPPHKDNGNSQLYNALPLPPSLNITNSLWKKTNLFLTLDFWVSPSKFFCVACINFFGILYTWSQNTFSWSTKNPLHKNFPGQKSFALFIVLQTTHFLKVRALLGSNKKSLSFLWKKNNWTPSFQVVCSSMVFM